MPKKLFSFLPIICLGLALQILSPSAAYATEEQGPLANLANGPKGTILIKLDTRSLMQVMSVSKLFRNFITNHIRLMGPGITTIMQEDFFKHGQLLLTQKPPKLNDALGALLISADAGNLDAMEAVGKLYANPQFAAQLPLIFPPLPPIWQNILDAWFTPGKIRGGHDDENDDKNTNEFQNGLHLLKAENFVNVSQGISILERLFLKTRDPQIIPHLLDYRLCHLLHEKEDQINIQKIQKYSIEAATLGGLKAILYTANGMWCERIDGPWKGFGERNAYVALYLGHQALTQVKQKKKAGAILTGLNSSVLNSLVKFYYHGKNDQPTTPGQMPSMIVEHNYDQVCSLLKLGNDWNEPIMIAELARLLEGKNNNHSYHTLTQNQQCLKNFKFTSQDCWKKLTTLEDCMIKQNKSASLGCFIKCTRLLHGEGVKQDQAQAYQLLTLALKFKSFIAKADKYHWHSQYFDFFGGILALDLLHAQFLTHGITDVLDLNLDQAADILFAVYSDKHGDHLLDEYGPEIFPDESRFWKMRVLAKQHSKKANDYLDIMLEKDRKRNQSEDQ